MAAICWEKPTPTDPLGRGDRVVMVGCGLMVMLYGYCVSFWLGSVTSSSKLKALPVVGVPAKAPAELKDSPGGNESELNGLTA